MNIKFDDSFLAKCNILYTDEGYTPNSYAELYEWIDLLYLFGWKLESEYGIKLTFTKNTEFFILWVDKL